MFRSPQHFWGGICICSLYSAVYREDDGEQYGKYQVEGRYKEEKDGQGILVFAILVPSSPIPTFNRTGLWHKNTVVVI